MQHETAFSVFGGMPQASSIRILFADADYTVRLCTYAPSQVMPRHTHPTMGLSVVLAGDLAEEAEGSEEFAAPFSVVVKPAEVAHRNRFGPRGARLLSIELTAAFTDSLDANTVGLRRWRWCHDRARVPLGLHVGRLLSEPLTAPSAELDGLLAEFLAVFDETPALRRTPPTWMCRVRDRLRAEFVAPPPATVLAAHAGVHRVHLARSFRRHFGVSTTAYARRLRVKAAATRLSLTRTPLAEVALDAGFADQSHLCRTFKAETGLTPGAYRSLTQS